MPSGHGSHSHSSHSSHSFGGSRSSHSRGSFGGSRSYRPTMRWRPHTTIFFGRPIYLGTARARTVSVLGILTVLAILATVFLGFAWMVFQDEVDMIRDHYKDYTAIAEHAANYKNDSFRVEGTVTRFQEYKDSGKYRILYKFTVNGFTIEDGYSFYVYDRATAQDLYSQGTVMLALEVNKDTISSIYVDSVPLDYWQTKLTDDAEYVENVALRNGVRLGTLVALGVVVLIIVSQIAIQATAKKATPEQIAANNADSNTASANQNTPTGTWRCGYCGTLNDDKHPSCEGCGAKRQK